MTSNESNSQGNLPNIVILCDRDGVVAWRTEENYVEPQVLQKLAEFKNEAAVVYMHTGSTRELAKTSCTMLQARNIPTRTDVFGDNIISSDDSTYSKTKVEHWQLIMKKFGWTANQIMVLDDNEGAVVAAQQAGIKATLQITDTMSVSEVVDKMDETYEQAKYRLQLFG